MRELNVVSTIAKLAAVAVLSLSTFTGCGSASETANDDISSGGSGGGEAQDAGAGGLDGGNDLVACESQVETVSAGGLAKSSKYSMVYSVGRASQYHGNGKSDRYSQGGPRCNSGDGVMK